MVGISAAVEGLADEAILRRIVEAERATLSRVYGKAGKQDVLRKIRAYNSAARFSPWIVLLDLDNDAECAPPFRQAQLLVPSAQMILRIAVREVEAWLLADREHLAQFLSVPVSRMPQDPEGLTDPKQEMVNLARRSRKRAIREDMVPRPGSGRSVGPAYTSRVIEFAQTTWDPLVAEQQSASLLSCRRRVLELVERWP
jgi:hypothetical protein